MQPSTLQALSGWENLAASLCIQFQVIFALFGEVKMPLLADAYQGNWKAMQIFLTAHFKSVKTTNWFSCIPYQIAWPLLGFYINTSYIFPQNTNPNKLHPTQKQH